MKKRIFSALLFVIMLISIIPTIAFSADAEQTPWQHSKSKTASALSEDLESTIKLSLPSAEEPLATDIVLVMDVSMCAEEVLPATQKFLQDIYEVQENSNATIKTGIVMFKGNAVPFQPLTVMSQEENTRMQELFNSLIVPGNKEETKNAVRAYLKKAKFTDGDGKPYDYANSGTNMPAGLLLAKEMLDKDTSVDAGRKYMVLISDGSTYLFTHDSDYTAAYTRSYGSGSYSGGLYESNMIQRDKPSTPPGGYNTAYYTAQDKDAWMQWLAYVGEHESEFTQYDFLVDFQLLYDGNLPDYAKTIPIGTDNYLLNNYTSLYQSAQTFFAMEDSGYHCYYSYMFDSEGSQANPMFNALLDAGQLINADEAETPNVFDRIKNDIFYFVGAGSKVVDVIGADFDFVNDVDTLSLTVGKDALAKKCDGTTFYFGDAPEEALDEDNYRFKLEYDEPSDTLTWTINEVITNLNPVQLSYRVKLTVAEPENGEKYYTNESATLTPVDSDGEIGADEEFERPYVVYNDSSNGLTASIMIAGLDTDDHIAYVYGYPDGTVRPDGTITRAEVTTIFYRLLTNARRDEIFTSENSFRDVDSSKWYNKAASSMAAGGYIQGYSDGTFGADKPITRAEFVAIASRFAAKTTGFASYSDVDNGHWAARAIAVCASNGWVQGYEDGTFRPDQPITRAEAMTIINRMLGRGVSKGYICKGAVRYPDNEAGSWYYYEVIEATNDHEYRNARPFEQWIRTNILRSYDMDKYERP